MDGKVPRLQMWYREKSPSPATTFALPEKDLSAPDPFLAQLSRLKGIFLPHRSTGTWPLLLPGTGSL